VSDTLLIVQEADNLHQLEVARRSADHIELRTNNRTLGFSSRMVDEVIAALQAVRSGDYEKAITQTSDRMARELSQKIPAPDYTDRATQPSRSERSQTTIPNLEDI
jgi:uncharacterized membrane protein YgcG